MADEPNIAEFLVFIRIYMGINTTVLPNNAAVITRAYENSVRLVNQQINQADNFLYSEAVYNLGGDFIINFAPDQTGQTYFADLRKDFNIHGFVGGVIQSASDVGTSESMVVPDFMDQLTFSDLQRLKTPWGRRYLEIAQSAGTLWGLS